MKKPSEQLVRSGKASDAVHGDVPPSEPLPNTDFARETFPVVGIGASAGGLEAITHLLARLPRDTGMAFVVIQHLDPTRSSGLTDALGRATQMTVQQAANGTRLEPNHVYVIPPDADLGLLREDLVLVPRSGADQTIHKPIDSFFRALAVKYGSAGVGVVLSGTGSDGTEGLKAIKAEGGITFAQEPGSAKFSGMPDSAIAAGVVDFRLAPEEIALELTRLSRHPYLTARKSNATIEKEKDEFKNLFQILRQSTGVDFTEYKSSTIWRRLERRMALKRVADLSHYLRSLSEDAEEVKALSEDILIHVTGFFREPEAFAALKKLVFPEIIKSKKDNPSVRVWIPGCATGEEVYSIAICLLECLRESGSQMPIQIFGSDLSAAAIGKARLGIYNQSAVRNLSPERLKRFFTATDEGTYRINKMVRDNCVFVQHDVTRDPPFSKLDLVSCRNVLIYFGPALQQRVIPIFHYSLNVPGFLLLGHNESAAGFDQLFSPVDKTQRIFSRTSVSSRLVFATPAGNYGLDPPTLDALPRGGARTQFNVEKRADQLLLARHAPPGVLVNEAMEIVQFRGRTGPYLEPAPGQPQANLLRMAREGLSLELRLAFEDAKKTGTIVRREGAQVRLEDQTKTVNVEVLPVTGIPDSGDRHFLVLFEDASESSSKRRSQFKSGARSERGRQKRGARTNDRQILQLTEELASTKEYVQSLLEEHQQTDDQLTTTNEELLSSNEELKSTNEELQTAQEELQSSNEELHTLNDELKSLNNELYQVNNDLINLITSVDIPIIIVSIDRRLRRFSPRARTIMDVTPADIGRPINQIQWNLWMPDLEQWLSEVFETSTMKEAEVQDQNGHWYQIQVRPYKTLDNKLDGAVVSIADINVLKHLLSNSEVARDEAAKARVQAEEANRGKDLFLALLSHELRTPLTAMLLQAQLLRSGGLDLSKIKRASEVIERGVKVQTKLIDDLLDISSNISGKLRMERVEVDLTSVMQSAVDMVRASAEAKSIEMQVELDRPGSRVLGDATRLKQVIWNLLTNAIKYTPNGGWVLVSLERRDAHARITVSDSGRGISTEFLPRVFEPFSQADSSTTRAYGGLGLGLAIVRNVVDFHGGRVRAASAGEGKGATFEIVLPLLEASSAPKQQASDLDPIQPVSVTSREGESPHLNGIRVLLVDDDPDGCDAIVEALEKYGSDVKVARSASEAMQTLEQFSPEVLLCDISMPGEDGYSLLARVRKLGAEHGGQVPAAAVTAHAGKEEQQRALAAGFQMHVPKPIDLAKLVAIVAKLSGRTNQTVGGPPTTETGDRSLPRAGG